jgi:hypothetical protein
LRERGVRGLAAGRVEYPLTHTVRVARCPQVTLVDGVGAVAVNTATLVPLVSFPLRSSSSRGLAVAGHVVVAHAVNGSRAASGKIVMLPPAGTRSSPGKQNATLLEP